MIGGAEDDEEGLSLSGWVVVFGRSAKCWGRQADAPERKGREGETGSDLFFSFFFLFIILHFV